MKRFIIGSGWKMNNTVADSMALLDDLEKELEDFADFPLYVLPPFTALSAVEMRLDGWKQMDFGAQNMHWEESGAFTGEISAKMLKELDCKYVELNHQERRAYFNETNETTNKKVHAALKHELRPILCLGEEAILPDAGVRSFLEIQMDEMLAGVDREKIPKILFAYEPRWAIGKTEAAPVTHIRKVHGIIRSILAGKYGENIAAETYILYGGSVDSENAVEIAVQDGVDGLFIGRCGLNAKTFAGIISNVACAIK